MRSQTVDSAAKIINHQSKMNCLIKKQKSNYEH